MGVDDGSDGDTDAKKGDPETERPPSLKKSSRMNSFEFETVRPDQRVLTPDEKMYLLNVERGDLAYVKRIVQALGKKVSIFDINCVDPLGRTALVIAIENENIELVQYLLEAGIELKDSLLIAIREDYVDGVDCLLRFEEANHKEGTHYSWEGVDQVTANFTPDITPLTLAAHRNNYEILKMLLDRGATIPMPHDVKCSCDDCVEDSSSDSLQFSISRINAYKALASPSLIALSSKDPILTAFELSNELKRLSVMEAQFKDEYQSLRKQVQQLATGLVEHARTSYELEVLLNHNPDGEPWVPGEMQTLERLKLAIDSNQKKFVTHPSVQQLLGAIWYDGLPGFRRMHIIRQLMCVFKHACMFPFYSQMYILAPNSSFGKFAKKPFVKFISHSTSYMVFLGLLALASQRAEHIVVDIIVFLVPGTEWLADIKAGWEKHERGSLPTVIEMGVILWVQALTFRELVAMFKEGLLNYLMNMWNLADIFSYGSFMNWIGLRALSWCLVQKELWDGKHPDEVWIPRDQWKSFDPYLLSEGMFGAGMISSFLKLIHIFSINPYLGPLQVSLGKMVVDIAKWLVIYLLVLFSFGCGLNKLLWYYADLEMQQCYSLPNGEADFENYGDSCVMWRRFANLWETSQSLFWASFGLVDLGDFELKGIKSFTRFWGLLMFGSYSVCNIIVLLNMLIAMMSNSYTIISSQSDTEWKFARSKLWISFFGEGDTVAAPFNLIPKPKVITKICCCRGKTKDDISPDEAKKASNRYYGVVRCLVRRYITHEQRKDQDSTITEDDINEVRQDIRSFRFELVNILKMNDMKVPQTKSDSGVIGRKSKDLERMIQKGFQISKIEGVMEHFFSGSVGGGPTKPKDLFKKLAKKVVSGAEKPDWNAKVRQASVRSDPIGSTEHSIRRRNQSFKRSLLARGNSQDEIDFCLNQLSSEQLLSYNPKLKDYTPLTRLAYAKFKSRITIIDESPEEGEELKVETVESGEKKGLTHKDSKISRLMVENELKQTKDSSTSPSKPVTPAPAPKPDPVANGVSAPTKSKDAADPTAPTDNLEKMAREEKEMEEKKRREELEQVKERERELEKEKEKQMELELEKEKERQKELELEKERELAKEKKKEEERKRKEEKERKRTAEREREKELERQKEEEAKKEEPARFDPKGKSVSTGRSITGWI